MKAMKTKKNYYIITCVIIIISIIQIVIIGVMVGIGPLGFIKKNRIASATGNAEEYHLENVSVLKERPLFGKKICFLGSSVTKGENSLNVSFVDYIAIRNSCEVVKEAVSGTTLVDNGSKSYIQRMINNINPDEKFDYFVCQLSTNDAKSNKKLGTISESTALETFDTNTIIGAIEYIICYAKETWNCPIIFYTGTKFDNEKYSSMVDAILELQTKYNIGVIDLWNNKEMNMISKEDYSLYMYDSIHPTQAGYLKWWTPVMEEYLFERYNIEE